MSFWTGKKVLVTGGHGFVGHAVLEALHHEECSEIHSPRKLAFDLTDEYQVINLFQKYRPNIVLHLAGKVGGIYANKTMPAEFFYENLMMGTLVMHYAHIYGVQKAVVLAAGCGYPKHLEPPYKEEDFWKDLPDENSIGYSMAKKMLIVQSWTYREQYGFNSSVLLPANLYGCHDNFHLEHSHVVPALVRKFVEAVESGAEEVIVWGSGNASREFLYVDDAAIAILKVAERYNETGPLNLGTGVGTTVRELIETIKRLTGFAGNIVWDTSKPDGQPRRFYDMNKFKEALDYVPDTTLEDGLKETIEWYRHHRQK